SGPQLRSEIGGTDHDRMPPRGLRISKLSAAPLRRPSADLILVQTQRFERDMAARPRTKKGASGEGDPRLKVNAHSARVPLPWPRRSELRPSLFEPTTISAAFSGYFRPESA